MTLQEADLENTALRMKGDLGIEWFDWAGAKSFGQFALRWMPGIIDLLKVESNGTLGEIVAVGRSSCGAAFVGKHGFYSTPFVNAWDQKDLSVLTGGGLDGRKILERIAAAVIAAAIFDMFRTASEDRLMSERQDYLDQPPPSHP
jgi:hypothetical protein